MALCDSCERKVRGKCKGNGLREVVVYCGAYQPMTVVVDAVEVVRCRECKHGLYSEYYGNVVCSVHHWTRGPKYYCADGQCREDGDDNGATS